jgi:hypothetical protein
MDYIMDFNDENNDNNRVVFPQFIYDDRRTCPKIFIFLKSLGLVLYSITLPSCNRSDFYIIMIIVMFLSTLNSLRYEYQHYKRYRTIFSNLNDFNNWKNNLWPKSRIFFSIFELSIKIGFFIKTFPPELDLRNICDIGETIYKLHIIFIFIVYFIICSFSMCLLLSAPCNQHLISNSNSSQQILQLPIPIELNNQIIINNQNEECSICLDLDNTQTWVILPCGHKFHGLCVSLWLNNHQTCPICRINIINLE